MGAPPALPGRGRAGRRGQALSPLRVRQGSTRVRRTTADRHHRAGSTVGDQRASRPPARRGAACPVSQDRPLRPLRSRRRRDLARPAAGADGKRSGGAERTAMGSPVEGPTRPGAYSIKCAEDTNHLRSKIETRRGSSTGQQGRGRETCPASARSPLAATRLAIGTPGAGSGARPSGRSEKRRSSSTALARRSATGRGGTRRLAKVRLAEYTTWWLENRPELRAEDPRALWGAAPSSYRALPR